MDSFTKHRPDLARRLLLRIARAFSAFEEAHDPWAVREAPFGTWRLRRRACRALEALEDSR